MVWAQFYDFAYALAEVIVPSLESGAHLWLANTLAEIRIPVPAFHTTFGLAFARARNVVPIIARLAHHRPFAQAIALLPVPILVIRAVEFSDAFALAGNWVPFLL